MSGNYIYNVRDYGAIGDGISDDTKAIQDTINAAQQNPYGGTVWLSGGRYLVSASLEITNSIEFRGNGQQTINGGTQIVPKTGNFTVIHAHDIQYGLVFSGFDIKRGVDPVAFDTGVGIHIQNVNVNTRITNVNVFNMAKGFYVDSSGGVVAENCKVRVNKWGWRVAHDSTGNSNATTLVDCSVDGMGEANGFVLANGYNSLNTTRCYASSCKYGFYSTKMEVDGITPGTIPMFYNIFFGGGEQCEQSIIFDDMGGVCQISQFFSLSGSSQKGAIVFGEDVKALITVTDSSISPGNGGIVVKSNHQSAYISINGGIIHGIGSDGLQVGGNAKINVNGLVISELLEHGGRKPSGIRILNNFTGIGSFVGVGQNNAYIGFEVDEDASGQIMISAGYFLINFAEGIVNNSNIQIMARGVNGIPDQG